MVIKTYVKITVSRKETWRSVPKIAFFVQLFSRNDDARIGGTQDLVFFPFLFLIRVERCIACHCNVIVYDTMTHYYLLRMVMMMRLLPVLFALVLVTTIALTEAAGCNVSDAQTRAMFDLTLRNGEEDAGSNANFGSLVAISESKSSVTFAYNVTQSETWGGQQGWTMHPGEGMKVFDWNGSSHVAFDFAIEEQQSAATRITLRVVMLEPVVDDPSDPLANADNAAQTEYWYAFLHGILDCPAGKNQTAVIPLSEAGFTLPGWTGSKGDEALSANSTTKIRFEFSIDGDAQSLGSNSAGIATISNLRGVRFPPENECADFQDASCLDSADTSRCVMEKGVNLLHHNLDSGAAQFIRKTVSDSIREDNYETRFQDCCDILQSVSDGAVYVQTSAWGSCYIMSTLEESQAVVKRHPDNMFAFAGWVPDQRPEACGENGVCDCSNSEHIDCSKRGLNIVPAFSQSTINDTVSLDLAGNAIGMITTNMFQPRGLEGTETKVVWPKLSVLNIQDCPRLSYIESDLLQNTLSHLNSLLVDERLSGELIVDLDSRFKEVCCEPQPSGQLSAIFGDASSSHSSVYACDYQDWYVGIDCHFENWVEYAAAESYIPAAYDGSASIKESDPRYPRAAMSASECCELCSVSGECSHFVYRNPKDADAECMLKSNDAQRLSQKESFDGNGGPEWISGFPIKDVGILLSADEEGQFASQIDLSKVRSDLDENGVYFIPLFIKLSSPPGRGSVWVEAVYESVGNETVSVKASKDSTFYQMNWDVAQRVDISVSFDSGGESTPIGAVRLSVRFVVSNACDASFLTAGEARVQLDVEYPSDSSNSHTIVIAVVGTGLTFAALVAVAFSRQVQRRVLLSLGKETLLVTSSISIECLDIVSSYFLYFTVVRNSLELNEFDTLLLVIIATSTVPSVASLVELVFQGIHILKEAHNDDRSQMYPFFAHCTLAMKKDSQENHEFAPKNESIAHYALSVFLGSWSPLTGNQSNVENLVQQEILAKSASWDNLLNEHYSRTKSKLKPRLSELDTVKSRTKKMGRDVDLDEEIYMLRVLVRDFQKYNRVVRRYCFSLILFVFEDLPMIALTWMIIQKSTIQELKSTAFVLSLFTTCAGLGLKLSSLLLLPRTIKTAKWYRLFITRLAGNIVLCVDEEEFEHPSKENVSIELVKKRNESTECAMDLPLAMI